MVLSPGDFSVVIRALQTLNEGRSLSMPKLLVGNNQEGDGQGGGATGQAEEGSNRGSIAPAAENGPQEPPRQDASRIALWMPHAGGKRALG